MKTYHIFKNGTEVKVSEEEANAFLSKKNNERSNKPIVIGFNYSVLNQLKKKEKERNKRKKETNLDLLRSGSFSNKPFSSLGV